MNVHSASTESEGRASVDDGGPAFPLIGEGPNVPHFAAGMSLRDYFAIHGPEPTEDAITAQQSIDRGRNPHNDSYKPRLRERSEIVCYLRYMMADAMLKARK